MQLSLRSWIEEVGALGEMREISGAHWDLEIGTIVDILMEASGNPAVLFDAIPGFPPGYRVLGNVLTSPARVAVSGGLDPKLSKLELVAKWRGLNSDRRLIPYECAPDGPVKECVQTGADVNLRAFPAPRWHELDGGQFIGTGCLVVQRDPDSGWVNTGAYRVMVQDEKTAGIMITRGRNGDVIMRKYWERGQACPVAISLGQHPLFLMLAGIPLPEGLCEYDFAGGIAGQPVQCVETDYTRLPVPADAELVIEGEIPPDERRQEGPFGEWTGYYAAPEGPQPVVNIKAIYHRRDPINLGVLPGKPPNDNTYYLNYLQSALVWDQLEKAGIPAVQGVWAHESGGGRMLLTVSIKQQYPGHSKQAGLVATACRSGAYVNHLTIVVDEDIDPTNTDEVIWALCSRVDPREDVEILRRMQASPLDPMSYPADVRAFNARMVIDACRPWERLQSFPKVARANPELRRRIKEKFHQLFE
jgi:UbiD family decarboxylase